MYNHSEMLVCCSRNIY